jgi:hypothetical protein
MLNHRSHEVERIGGEGGGEGGGKEGDGEDESGERVVISTHCGLSKWSLERCSSLTELQTWAEEKEKEFKHQRAHVNLIKPFYFIFIRIAEQGDRSITHSDKSRTRLKY